MRVFLDTVGCRLNQSEIEMMARQFRAAGHEIVASAEGAELAVVNTCAVTAEAAADSRGKIRHVARVGAEEIVATGCWATLQPEQALALPNVRRVVPNHQKDGLVAETLHLPPSDFDLEPIVREPLPGIRHRTRAFIKVQDGCDNHCTFCITTVARGEGRSRRLTDVIEDVKYALKGGTQEIVLTGVHLGSWGQDFGGRLHDLVQAILQDTEVPRLRLSSLEPWDLDADFFSLWTDPRLCRHLHLPLQSGCAETLRRMARKTSPASFRNLIAAARWVMPDVAITTDVIAGFPGETASEFAESLDFIRQIGFAGGHAFTYSPRPGTGAARMAGQLRPEVRKERSAVLRAIFEEAAVAYYRKFVGETLPVLWEATTQLDDLGWQMQGLTGNYLRVMASAPQPLWNQISRVRLQSFSGDRLSGLISA